MPDYTWIIAAASVMGAAHHEQKLPCQDCCGILSVTHNCGVAVVCDGAGSRTHSDIGAQEVVNYVLRHFSTYCQSNELYNTTIPPSIDQWQKDAVYYLSCVKDDLADYAQANNLSVCSLACTVIVVIYTPFGLLCANIGDGRAAYRNEQGEWRAIVVPFHGEEINSTVFITSDIWENTNEYIHTCVIEDPCLTAFCLLSDGCEKASFEVNLFDADTNKYYDPNRPYLPFFEPNIYALQNLYEQQKSQTEINQLWADFLEAGNNKLRIEPDDKTMILAVRSIEANV